MWHITLRHPWLIVEFPSPVTCIGWTLQGGGRVRTNCLLWRQVRNEELTEEFDVSAWLQSETAGLNHPSAPCFLTSAAISKYVEARAVVEEMSANVLVTLGLGNAERIGQRRNDPKPFGTINAALIVNRPLSDSAALEAISLLTEARTTAMLEHAPLCGAKAVTGTGTDCLAVCFPDGAEATVTHAGKHTALGEAIGAAALEAFSTAILHWRPSE